MTRDRIAALAAPIARDLAGLAGGGLIVAGVAEWSHAAAMVVAGLALLGGAVVQARRS